jgi:sialate O-acetylesterase
MQKKGVLFFFLLLAQLSSAALTLNRMFSDNMVLQRDKPVPFFGTSTPGAAVKVVFGGKHRQTIADEKGIWKVVYGAQKASARPHQLEVSSGTEILTLSNIVVGDVWVCTGQSNMEWPLKRELHFNDEQLQTDNALLRINNPLPAGRYVYGVSYTDSLVARLTVSDFYLWEGWQESRMSTASETTAIGYYFAKQLIASTGVPVGIINLAIGGAPLESFISTEAMKAHPVFKAKVEAGDWLHNESLPVWTRERGSQNIGSLAHVPADERGKNHAYKPGFAYESGIEPLLPLAVKGILLYQGESNSQEPERVAEFRELQRLMITSYRKAWGNPEMPFYWVQLSSIDSLRYRSQLWPWFRNEQRLLASELSFTGMAVSSDHGARHDVHPTNKKVIGERLARIALKELYGRLVAAYGPEVHKAEYKKGRVIVSFKHAKRLSTADSMPLRAFSLDGKTVVDARIEKNKVVIPADHRPVKVYYGWQPYSEGNLINEEGLPASSFEITLTTNH